jgi:hypothetical protein
MFVPETKGVTLEELDEVFSVKSSHHAAYGLRQIGYGVRRYALRQNIEPESLYSWHDEEKPFARGGNPDVEKAATEKAAPTSAGPSVTSSSTPGMTNAAEPGTASHVA